MSDGWDSGELTWRPPTKLRLRGAVRRRGLPIAAVRPDWELLPLNGARLRTPGHDRPQPAGAICAVAYRLELRPSVTEVLAHAVDPQSALVRRSRITGGVPVEEYEAGGGAGSADALESATAAAAALLGHPVTEHGRGALVEAVRRDTTGLRQGDVIVGAAGRRIDTAGQLMRALADVRSVQLDVLRDPFPGAGSPHVGVRLDRHPDATWGIRVSTAGRTLEHGLAAEFDLPGDVRGPSLGLASALSIIDAYTDGQLAAAGHVVATGIVTKDGRVDGVGAVEYKARAVAAHPRVSFFLVPAEVPEDLSTAERILAGRAKVVPVNTVEQIVSWLRNR